MSSDLHTISNPLAPFTLVSRATGLMLVCALSWLLAGQTAGQSTPAKPKFLATNLKSFGIPFRINANDESFIEVQLYVSSDQGRNWRFVERQSTDKNEFPFRAEEDGDYWFAIKTLNRNRQLIPEGKPSPELIIQVDTALPELSFDVQADAAGRIECRWKADDKNLKAESVAISYQPIGADPDNWTAIPINLKGLVRNGSYADQLAWWPETTERSLNVRLSIADQAGNTIFRERRVNVAPAPWRHRNQSTALLGQSQTPGPAANSAQPPTSPARQTPDTSRSSDDTLTQWKKGAGFIADRPVVDSEHDYDCENGVCVPRTAANGNPAPKSTMELRVAGGTQQGHQVSQVDSNPGRSDLANSVGSGASASNLYGAPPDRTAAQNGLPPNQDPSRPAIGWESERESWTRQNQTSSSTVRSPPVNPQLAPTQAIRPADNPNLPNPNPNQTTRDGLHTIGQSTTKFPNQYQGLPPQTLPIPRPEFLTGDEASNWNADNQGNQQPASEPASNTHTPSSEGAVPPQIKITGQSINPHGQANQNPVYNSMVPEGLPQQDRESANSQPTRQPQPMVSASYRPEDEQPGSVMEEPALDSGLQMISSKRFRLNYAIDAIDPSGVARVDLWMTRDGGATWKSWGNDPDNQSPFPVEVDEEGRYGFRIVIHSRDGLTGRGPSRGDSPDINVQVDTQAPLTQIVSVPYGRASEAGRLIVNYRVNDPHLTLRPNSLFYATYPQGPWTPIEEGLRNEGRFVWKPTANVPDRVFLRLDALDRAGNRGTHSLTQAIDISGLVPRGTIQGVVPVDQQ